MDYRQEQVNKKTEEIRAELGQWDSWIERATTIEEKEERLDKQRTMYRDLVHSLLWVVEGDAPMADSCRASLTGVSHGMTYGMIGHLSSNTGLFTWSIHT